MSINGLYFLCIFAVVLTILAIIQGFRDKSEKAGRLQLIILLLFSYCFIAMSDWRFCVCVIAVTVFTYFIGLMIEKRNDVKILVGGGIGLVLFLGYFKYTNFFINSFRYIFGLDFVSLKIILPIGISFYVFSALSYLVDVYRGDYDAERNIVNFALYIAFFPKITAGPIVRGADFFPQVKNYRGIKCRSFLDGIQIYMLGLFKKIVLANHLGVFVDDVFANPVIFHTGTIAFAVISYSLQIYFDFSGYSDMAIGISKIIGFDFPKNFNIPYIAKGMSDFWSRWHISLSSWFRDYLYIPLGGSRKGKTRTYGNLLIVMTASGLWHGAGVTFILWGVLHGTISCVSRIIEKSRLKIPAVFRAIVTFLAVSLLWVLFRADSVGNAIELYMALFTWHDGIMQPYTWSFFAIVVLIIGTVVASWKCKGKEKIDGFYPVMKLNKVWTLAVFFTFVGLTIILGYFGNTAFIYGKF